jgi:hypothetical protein
MLDVGKTNGRTWQTFLCCGCFVLMLFHIIPVWAEYPPPLMGYIGSFNCSSKNFTLVRSQKKTIVEINRPLYKDDTVTVTKKGCSITLKLDRNVVVKKSHTVGKDYKKPSTIGGIRKSFLSWWSNLWKLTNYEERMVATRGGYYDLVIPFPNNSQLKVGKETVYLAWRGGKPPFKVSVYRAPSSQKNWLNSQDWQNQEENSNITKLSNQVKLEEDGVYLITIRDDNGKSVTSQFTVVGKLPSFQINSREKREIEKVHGNRQKREACAGVWFEKQGKKPEWSFEAYQIVEGSGDQKILSTCGLD